MRTADLVGDGYLDFEEFYRFCVLYPLTKLTFFYTLYSIFVGLEIFLSLEKDMKHAIRKEDLKRTLRKYGLDTNEVSIFVVAN